MPNHNDVGQTKWLYQRTGQQIEVCNYGDQHIITLYKRAFVTITKAVLGPDVSGYDQNLGLHLTAEDVLHQEYKLPYDANGGTLWTRTEDNTHWTDRPWGRARDWMSGEPLTKDTPGQAVLAVVQPGWKKGS
jgi:hypothetical protein